MRLSEEIFIEIPVVIGKIVAGNQHKRHLLSLGCFHHSIEKERLQSGGKEQHLYEKCKITVLKTTLDKELAEEYGDGSGAGIPVP